MEKSTKAVKQNKAIQEPFQVPTLSAPEKKADEDALTISSVTVQSISSPAPEVDVNVGLTKVKINYPKNFAGEKFFSDGDEKFVSRDVAEQFVNAGIATIL